LALKDEEKLKSVVNQLCHQVEFLNEEMLPVQMNFVTINIKKHYYQNAQSPFRLRNQAA
jgi:hypothetical protein